MAEAEEVWAYTSWNGGVFDTQHYLNMRLLFFRLETYGNPEIVEEGPKTGETLRWRVRNINEEMGT